MNERKPIFWDARDSERLTHDNKDDAIYDALDYMQMIDLDAGKWTLPRTMVVRGMAPMRVRAGTPERLLEHILEMLDEEHGDPASSHISDPTPAMLAAAKALIEVVEREYVSWACEEVTSEAINVREWMAKNAADYWDDFPGVDDPNVSWVGREQ